MLSNLTPYLSQILGTAIVVMAYYAVFNWLSDFMGWK